MLNNNEEWEQVSVIHCPNINCKGMLLQHSEHNKMKCSCCGKYYLAIINYVQVKKPKINKANHKNNLTKTKGLYIN